MKVNKNIWTGKNKPYNRNSLYFPNGVNSDGDNDGSAGGGESGGSSWKYLDVSKMPTGVKEMQVLKCIIGMFGKFRSASGAVQISPLAGYLAEGKIENMDNIYAVAYDKKFIIVQEGMVLEQEAFLEMAGITQMFGELGITEITEAEFYDLNA